MRKFRIMIAGALALLTIPQAFGAQLPVPQQDFPGVSNLLVNAGFENGAYGWTASGGATKTADTTSKGAGNYGYDWDSSSASQTLISNSVTIPSGLYGKPGVAYCSIKAASGSPTHTIVVDDGSTNLVTAQTIGTTTSAFSRNVVYFTFPTSGGVRLKLTSVASNEPAIYIDSCFLGENTKLVKPATKNYIQYSDFENASPAGWTLKNSTLDSTSKLPNQASGSWSAASGNLSLAIVSSGQLEGTASLSYVSSAATTAGDMVVSQPYTIDAEDQARVLTFRFAYSAASGASNVNFSGTSSNSYGVAIYDVTNSAWIQPAGVYNIVQGTGTGTASGTFQVPSNTTSVRFAVYNVNATAGAATLYLDDFFLGPQTAPIAAAMSDWQSYTPTVNNATKGTGYTLTGYWRRVGDSAEIMIKLTFGTTASVSSVLGFTLPTGLTADINKLVPASGDTGAMGTATAYDSSASNGFTGTARYVAARTQIEVNGTATGSSSWDATHPMTWADGDIIEIGITIPITGWSSNTVGSSDIDTRVVAAGASLITSDQTVNSGATDRVQFNNSRLDTHSALDVSGTKGRFTAPIPGYYNAKSNLQIAMGATAASNLSAYFTVNGGSVQYGRNTLNDLTNSKTYSLPIQATLHLNAGDYVDVVVAPSSQNVTVNQSATNDASSFYIERLSGPATITATESVNAHYHASATSLSGSLATISWTTSDYDSHAGMSSGTYTLPVSGKFHVNSCIAFSAASSSAGNAVDMQLQKNGSVWTEVAPVYQGTQVGMPVCISDDVSGSAGDTIRIQASSAATTPAITSSNSKNFFSISRVGN